MKMQLKELQEIVSIKITYLCGVLGEAKCVAKKIQIPQNLVEAKATK